MRKTFGILAALVILIIGIISACAPPPSADSQLPPTKAIQTVDGTPIPDHRVSVEKNGNCLMVITDNKTKVLYLWDACRGGIIMMRDQNDKPVQEG